MSDFDASRCAGAFLKRLIEENGMTQESFAFDFGADVRTVNRYVNNGINKITVLQELAEYFQVSILDFFQGM